MKTNKGLFQILYTERGKDLFRNQILTEILQKVNSENSCQGKVFEELKYKFIHLYELEDRRVNLFFKQWLQFHKLKDILTNNIHWNVCVERDTPHHLFRDGLNETNENILEQGYILKYFTHMNEGNSNVAFWLYTRETPDVTSFIATTMVFFDFNELFLFNEKGMSSDK